MSLSKISRGLIVAIFVAVIVFFGVIDIKILIQNPGSNGFIKSLFPRLSYVVSIFVLTLIYVYIKDKLYKLKIKRNISMIYRYVYLISTTLVTRYIFIRDILKNSSLVYVILNFVITILIAIVVKRIVFNISKSDILSVITFISSSMYVNVIEDKTVFLVSMIIVLVNVTSILIIQFLIDELKQKGIKTKKYVLFSILLGLLIGLSIILGTNMIVWLIVLFVLFFISMDLDRTHLNFPRVLTNSVSNKNKDRLYKLERININKILVSSLIAIAIMLILLVIYKLAFINLEFTKNITDLNNSYIISDIDINFNINLIDIIKYTGEFLKLSQSYYLVVILYILLLEVLSFFLRRKYDTKTTCIKTIFILMFFFACILNVNILYLQPLFNNILVIIAVINTSSLYLNREERVKMLVA